MRIDFVEAIDHILALWSGDAPYNRKGKFWDISTGRTLIREAGQGVMLKPYQQPHPPIVVIAIVPHSSFHSCQENSRLNLPKFSPAQTHTPIGLYCRPRGAAGSRNFSGTPLAAEKAYTMCGSGQMWVTDCGHLFSRRGR